MLIKRSVIATVQIMEYTQTPKIHDTKCSPCFLCRKPLCAILIYLICFFSVFDFTANFKFTQIHIFWWFCLVQNLHTFWENLLITMFCLLEKYIVYNWTLSLATFTNSFRYEHTIYLEDCQMGLFRTIENRIFNINIIAAAYFLEDFRISE